MRQELLKELRIRKKELVTELEAIDAILDSNTISSVEKPSSNGKPKATTLFGTPKGEMTWVNYVKFMLKEIGGEVKSQDVVKRVIQANPEIDEKTIKNSVGAKLSKLYLAGKIGANEGRFPSEGHKYFIKK